MAFSKYYHLFQSKSVYVCLYANHAHMCVRSQTFGPLFENKKRSKGKEWLEENAKDKGMTKGTVARPFQRAIHIKGRHHLKMTKTSIFFIAEK